MNQFSYQYPIVTDINDGHEFSKKFEITLKLFSGAWGKTIHENNLKQQISWHCPFKKIYRFPWPQKGKTYTLG
jgi:hypothetical protein